MNTLDSASKREILDYVTRYPADIGRVVGFKDFTDLHNSWIKKMVLSEEDFTLQAHRGSYKTTCLSEAIALRMLFFPHSNIIFMRKTSSDVVEVVRQVSKILHSECLGYIYHRLYGRPIGFVGESNTSITLDNYDVTRGAEQLLGLGTVGSITGKHADCVITDDIVNLQDRVSAAERNRIKGIYQELQNIRNRGGVIINSGTPWHIDDAFSLMPNIEKFDCYTTHLISDETLQKLRDSMSPSLFAANYELRHIASENALFTQSPKFTKDEKLFRDGIAHIDAAYGGEDFTSFTCGKRVGDKLYMYGRMWHAHVDTVLDICIEETKRLMCGPIYCEENGDKGFLAKEIKNRNFRAANYYEKEGKYMKISNYLRKWWKNIEWLEGTDMDYLAQIMDYTQDAEHDDAPDSAAVVCRYYDSRSGKPYESPLFRQNK